MKDVSYNGKPLAIMRRDECIKAIDAIQERMAEYDSIAENLTASQSSLPERREHAKDFPPFYRKLLTPELGCVIYGFDERKSLDKRTKTIDIGCHPDQVTGWPICLNCDMLLTDCQCEHTTRG